MKVKKLAEVFAEVFKGPMPFPVPDGCTAVCSSFDEETDTLTEITVARGTLASERPLAIWADEVRVAGLQPDDFSAGFGGSYGLCSNAFVLVRVSATERIFFRIPVGNCYCDEERERVEGVTFLHEYERFRESPCARNIKHFLGIEASMGGSATYVVTLHDGRVLRHNRSLLKRPDFEGLVRGDFGCEPQ